MHVYQTSDRALFVANRPTGAPVRGVRMPSTKLVRRDGRISSLPAVELTYSFVRGDQEWVFQEKRVAHENNAIIDLRDTLWAELEQVGGYQLLQRSGSF